MERTKTLLSCLTDQGFTPASRLPPPAYFVYNIDLFRNVLMERYGLCFAHRMVLDIGTFIEFRLPLLQKPNLVRRASRNV